MTTSQVPAIDIPRDWLEDFCQRWKIRELSLFGSVLRDDFGPESDIDFLVSFQPVARPEDGWSLWDLFDMEAELKAKFGRDVDLVEKEALRNPFRRHNILTTSRVIFAA
ncbi:MAG: nucleotidyltransferase family protein [Dehalococcoidia bacterium]